jgi:hypothetical protein
MFDLTSVPSRSESVVTRKTGHEYVLVPVVNNIADMNSVFTLNETGAFIWEHTDGKRTIRDIIDALASEYNIDFEHAKTDVIAFFNEMSFYLIIKEK